MKKKESILKSDILEEISYQSLRAVGILIFLRYIVLGF